MCVYRVCSTNRIIAAAAGTFRSRESSLSLLTESANVHRAIVRLTRSGNPCPCRGERVVESNLCFM